MLTKQIIEKALPPGLKSAVTDTFVSMVNNVTTDPVIAEAIRENFVSYSSVLKDGKYKTEDYLRAVCYVSYKLMGDTNQAAYEKTFPQRVTDMVARGLGPQQISAYVSMYNKGKLVNSILQQTLVPSWVLNQDIYQRAINTQFELMTDPDVSPKVRSDAANSILTHLAKPKEAGPLLQIDMGENSGLNALKDTLTQLVAAQRDALAAGMSPKEVARNTVIDVEAVSVST